MASTSSDHTPPKAAYDDLSIRSIALVGGVGSVLVFVAVIAVQVVYFRYEQQEYKRKVLDVPTAKVDAIVAEKQEKLNTAGEGANPEQRERSIPIDKAMAIVLAEYQEQRAGADSEEQASQGGTTAGDLQVASEPGAAGEETPDGKENAETK